LESITAFSEKDYQWFSTKVESKFNVRLGDYKPEQMKRRLAMLADRCGTTSFVSYFSLLEKDPMKLEQFLNEMTINVTELLRNPGLFDVLMNEIIADRFPRRDGGEFRAWSAGCSYGAEAYTLAMLLHEKAGSTQFRVRGTDVDLTVLARANSPVFSPEDMVNISSERRQRHFMSPDGTTFLPQGHLKNRVDFSPQDLLSNSYPVAAYDLILCRNVLIYFTDDAKERIYQNLCKALKPGGVLFVGGSERLQDHARAGFAFVRPFFYEKTSVRSMAA
jgi:chemotaxis protein methyltransferase CheR